MTIKALRVVQLRVTFVQKMDETFTFMQETHRRLTRHDITILGRADCGAPWRGASSLSSPIG